MLARIVTYRRKAEGKKFHIMDSGCDSALQVQRVETVAARDNLDLLGFFYKAGFAPSQRLAFVKRIS